MNDLDSINTTFLNRQLAPEPEAGPFGVCFVAFSGTHNKRYRGERLLEWAATQMRAAAPRRVIETAQFCF